MKHLIILVFLFISMAESIGQAQQNAFDATKAEQEIRALYEIELQLVLRQDTAGMNMFYPDDFVVTNPFNQFINKRTVIERVTGNIIKYSTYQRNFDAIRFYDNTAIVIGSEVVVPTEDADRSDAGKTVNRRFSEVWIKRGTEWKKVMRHASNVN